MTSLINIITGLLTVWGDRAVIIGKLDASVCRLIELNLLLLRRCRGVPPRHLIARSPHRDTSMEAHPGR
jgi:hypothetical protein